MKGRGALPLSQLPGLGRHFADSEAAWLRDSPDERRRAVRQRGQELEAGGCGESGTCLPGAQRRCPRSPTVTPQGHG